MAVRSGKAIRFNEQVVRPIGRTASGVRGITLGHETDEVVGMICVENQSEDVLVISEKGYGKRSLIDDYRITNRGGKGVKTINITQKTGDLVTIIAVKDTNDLMIITQGGMTIRLAVSQVSVYGRATQGVRLINLKEDDKIASLARVNISEDSQSEGDEENPEEITDNNMS